MGFWLTGKLGCAWVGAFIYLFIYLLGANQKEHKLTDVVKRDGDQGNE